MISKKIVFIACLLFATLTLPTTSNQVSVGVQAEKHAKLKVVLVVVGRVSRKLEKIIPIIKNDLEFSGQFQVVVPSEPCVKLSRKSDIKNFFSSDCRLGIFLTDEKRNKSISWRLYDLENASMIKGLEYRLRGKDVTGWAHNISDSIWPVLANHTGFFSTKIAYCKEIPRPGKRAYKHIYVSDYDGSNEKLMVSTPTVNIAPRWNNDPLNPLLFYSEHTNENVRLVFVNMRRRIVPVSNFDGLNILSAFSHDGKKFAYCASRGDGYCQLYYYADRKLKRLTNKGNNISPTFADDGKTIYFCSDAETKCPQIYKYDLRNSTSQPVTHHGFYVSTSSSSKNGLLAYAKMVRGVMQIFVYNPKNKSHRQITFDSGNKEECSWSPCGNYLLFSVQKDVSSRIAIMNLLTNKIRFVTSNKYNCYYPCWSPIYAQFPQIR